MKIFIYGVPGVGKTYYSKKPGKELNIPIIEGDKFRKQLQKVQPRAHNPFLYSSTSKAFSHFGRLNSENAVKGLLAVRASLSQKVLSESTIQADFIMEAAFLDPNTLSKHGELILLVCFNEAIHKKHFLTHREKLLDLKMQEFKAARMIQDYLLSEAKSLKVRIIEN